MERAKKTIKLPVSGTEVVLYEWMNGGDKRKIASEPNQNSQLTLMTDALVVSIGGKTEKISEEVNNLHGKDFDFLFMEITAIISNSSLTPEKKSE